MMNRLLPLTFLLCFFVYDGFGQQSLISKDAQYSVPVPPLPHPSGNLFDSPTQVPGNHHMPSENRDEEEVVIGTTFFDLQTAGSTGRRIYTNGDEVSAIWHFGVQPTFPDRGTGYNHFDGSDWGPQPSARIENDIRGGYPSFTVLGDGTEVVVSHTSIDTIWALGVYRKAPGTNVWTQSLIPSVVSDGGMVWAKVATGGSDNQTLHVIAITLHADFGGLPYQGMDQHLLYFRSQDGGDSWDITDMIIPGCDSTLYNNIEAESYGIDANGETVSVGFFPSWGDAALFKSEDNGDSWDKTVIYDFPIDKYDGSGYTEDDIPLDTLAPDPLAIFTTDGYCSVVVDENNMTHVVYGDMYVNGIGGFFFYPSTDGLSYWNENMGTGNAQNIAFVEDLDGSGVIEVADIAAYFLSLTSMPSMGIDGQGNYYVAYSAFNELNIHMDDNQNYRQVYVVASTDGGATWTEPYAAINAETTEEELVPFIEGVYPNIPKNVGNRIQMIYQQDFQPGLHVSGDQDPTNINNIVYIQLDKVNIVITNTNETDLILESVHISPNPSSGVFNIEYVLNQSAEVEIGIFNMLGQNIFQLSNGKKTEGIHYQNIQMSEFSKGVYLVRMEADERVWTERIVLK